MDILAELAQSVARAMDEKEDFRPLRIGANPIDAELAYAVQEALIGRRGARATVAGYKIGLTSRAMQKMCGISTPIYGAILDDAVLPSGAAIEPRNYGRLGIEFEIAVRLGRAIEREPPPLAELAGFVDAICPALELIDDRNADYSRLDAPSIIANNAWNAGVVLGAWQPLPADLARRGARVLCGGSEIDTGVLGDAMGNPLEPVRWLAASLLSRGKTLPAQAIVMTGSVFQTRFPAPGEVWRYQVDGLGEVAVHL